MEGVRPATPADIPRLAELCRAGIAELTPMKGGSVWAAWEAGAEPQEDRLHSALDDPDRCVLAGTFDDVVIGYAVARVEVLRDGRSLGVVEELFVEEEARGVGVGEAMMGETMRWLVERGCLGVDAMALPGHRAAKNFFEEQGFTARALIMHRPTHRR